MGEEERRTPVYVHCLDLAILNSNEYPPISDTRTAEAPIRARLTWSMPIVTAASSLLGVAGLEIYAPALFRVIPMDGLLPVTLRRNIELLLYGAKCPTPPAPAPGILGHSKSDSCLSVAAPSPISLPRHHLQTLSSRGGAHILLTFHHPEGMHAISLIHRHPVRHLVILGALAPSRLY